MTNPAEPFDVDVDEPTFWLQGEQTQDPVCYCGRWPHSDVQGKPSCTAYECGVDTQEKMSRRERETSGDRLAAAHAAAEADIEAYEIRRAIRTLEAAGYTITKPA